MQQEDGNISPVRAFFRNKWVRVILIIDTIALLVVIGILIYNATKVSVISFNITPINATISVNGNTDFTNGQYKITPGTYEVKISHESLEPKTFTVDIAPHNVVALTTFLVGPDHNFEFYELKENYSSMFKLQQIASAENNLTTDHDASAEEFIAKFERTMSILEALPIKGYVHADPNVNASTAGFAIRDGISKEGCKKIACLLVNYFGSGYEEAVAEAIEEAGYNPKDYQIFYERYN